MTEYVTLEQAAVAFAIQSVFSTSDCLDALHYAIQKGWISPSDVAPVRHGRWIEPSRLYYGAKQYECSLCYSDTFWKKHSITEKYPHCPNCGAKMDGGDGNSDMA